MSVPDYDLRAEDHRTVLVLVKQIASEGWFHRLKKSESITFVKPHGEQGDADQGAAKAWIEEEWPCLIAEY
ncbi:hypothetical protein AVEN_115148-1 [Araneus ventricosus]|uniref:Uncharacterized protein n=1 Tax=Araneus ventricosus TaxID=182803 RepID=A0A4Y1ZXD6_ARAVE|nr:hypothetical protein AVEN_115148-1 [Araneus ventricosus]